MNEFFLRIIVATIVGTLIGMRTNSAASRMFIIICIGATLLTTVSTEYFKVVNYPWFGDPGRLSAQIIAALGFLGTGLIWVSEKQEVKGLIIAASVWLTAILGIIIGTGLSSSNIVIIICIIAIYFILTHKQME